MNFLFNVFLIFYIYLTLVSLDYIIHCVIGKRFAGTMA